MVCGTVRRQAEYVILNRYANAFYENATAPPANSDDMVKTNPAIYKNITFENKYELDSLIHVLSLATNYYNTTKDLDCFQESPVFLQSVQVILDVIASQQAGTDEDFDKPGYAFNRKTASASDTLINHGRGTAL